MSTPTADNVTVTLTFSQAELADIVSGLGYLSKVRAARYDEADTAFKKGGISKNALNATFLQWERVGDLAARISACRPADTRIFR